jgi:diacylglycerol kinase (ATP)
MSPIRLLQQITDKMNGADPVAYLPRPATPSIQSVPGRIRALVNPKSGVHLMPEAVMRIIRDVWDVPGASFDLQESLNPEDGKAKVRQAVVDGVDLLIVAGGDGMVNTLGSELIGTRVAMAVLPTGSGNGFARHFGIPLLVRQAALALRDGQRVRVDVGAAAGRPFFVTCGLAWDAELTQTFQRLPVRGMPSYIFAGLRHYFTYIPQNYHLIVDGEPMDVTQPLIFTVANLSQYGGGMKIAPDAKHDDGLLTMVVIPQTDALRQLSQMYRLIDGAVWKVHDLETRKFRTMQIVREKPSVIQMDGEVHEAGREFTIEVLPAALDVIIPQPRVRRRSWSLVKPEIPVQP